MRARSFIAKLVVIGLSIVALGVLAFRVAENYGIDITWPSLRPPPRPAHAPPHLDLRGSTILIAVDRNEQITWNGKPISCQELHARILEMFKNSRGTAPPNLLPRCDHQPPDKIEYGR